MNIEEVKAIVIAEKKYWDKADPAAGIAASGACCNILAALYGLRAPWHPQINPTPSPCCPDDLPNLPDHGRELYMAPNPPILIDSD